ncbi:MAG: hypothetical protein QNJ26_16870 [Desulfobacterales bacterium]|nr:hypothetical protein [Desulfobacterales bacterium]
MRILLPIVWLLIFILPGCIIAGPEIIMQLENFLLLVVSLLLSACITVPLRTVKILRKIFNAVFKQKEIINDRLISDYAISSKRH